MHISGVGGQNNILQNTHVRFLKMRTADVTSQLRTSLELVHQIEMLENSLSLRLKQVHMLSLSHLAPGCCEYVRVCENCRLQRVTPMLSVC